VGSFSAKFSFHLIKQYGGALALEECWMVARQLIKPFVTNDSEVVTNNRREFHFVTL
jgi:hypothetical protein